MTQPATDSRTLLQRLREPRGRCWVVGHRGAMGYCPENTLASFERALELGADWIELDVHLTRDGRLAVIHDETLERTTNGHGLVNDHSLAELQALDAGAWFAPTYAGQRIPSLDEVLAWARERGTVVDVEIKNAPIVYPGIEEAVVAALDRQAMTERAIVISFDHAAVRRVKALEPRLATGVLYAGRPADGGIQLARLAEADALLPHWSYVSAADVGAAHAAGLAVAPWVSSDPAVLRRLVEMEVDAIGTNHPDVLRQIVDTPLPGPLARATPSLRSPALQREEGEETEALSQRGEGEESGLRGQVGQRDRSTVAGGAVGERSAKGRQVPA